MKPEESAGKAEAQSSVVLVSIASTVGTAIEWYDFILYALMAGLVLNKLFFPAANPLVSTILSYATFSIGFLARPLGGIVFGHLGDRIGRKPLLVVSLTLMGAATFLIGMLPTYATWGVAAPFTLVVLRFLQGFAAGGEWGGAVLMAYEYSPPRQRGLFTSLPQMGLAPGLFLGTGTMALLSAVMSQDAFIAWGWRLPFLGSIPLLLIGLFVRFRLMETPLFLAAKASHNIAKVPIADVLRHSARNVGLGILSRLSDGSVYAVYALFSSTFLVTAAGLSRATAISAVTVASVLLAFTIPLAGWLSDKVGWRKLYIVSSLISGLAAFPLLWVMQYSGSPILAFFAIVVGLGVLWAPVYAPQAALFCSLFETRVKYTGISLIYHFGAIIGISFTPIAAIGLVALDNNKPWFLATGMLVACLVGAASAFAMRQVDEDAA
jgi:MFS transporter, MHS family, shikimate and dehydroshikimate transport protein